MSRVQTGDHDAFDRLTSRHWNHLLSFTLKHTRNLDKANDVLVEALSRMFASCASYKGDAKFLSWAFRIIVNCSIDDRRREAVRPSMSFEEAFGGLSEFEAPIEDPAWQAPFSEFECGLLEAERLRRLVRRLDPEDRRLVVLSYREGKTYREISDLTKMPIGTVKSKLSRTRARIRDDYDGRDEERVRRSRPKMAVA